MENEVAVVEEVMNSGFISKKVMITLAVVATVGVVAAVVYKLKKKSAKKTDGIEILTEGDTEAFPQESN